MAVIIDGTTGVATPGVTDTGDLSVAGSTTLTTPLPVTSGGTGASSLSGIAVGNLAGGSAGTIPYQSTVGTTAMLATGTSGQALVSAGPSAAPTWGTPTSATNLAGGSAGTVPYQSASGTTAMLSAGSSGQVLTSSGAGAPSWTTPSPGSWVTLSSGTISGSPTTLDFETGFTDTAYVSIVIMLSGVYTTSSGNPTFRFKQSGSYVTSASYSQQILEASGSSVTTNSGTTQTGITVAGSQVTSTSPYAGMFVVNNRFVTTASGPSIVSMYSPSGNGTAAMSMSKGILTIGAAIQGVRFYLSGGSGGTALTAGSYVVYGINAS